LGWGPPITPAQQAAFRLLTLQRPASTKPQPDSDEDFVEFADSLPPYCTIDRELSAKKGRTVLKWTYEKI